jgi:hypothetical protein
MKNIKGMKCGTGSELRRAGPASKLKIKKNFMSFMSSTVKSNPL